MYREHCRCKLGNDADDSLPVGPIISLRVSSWISFSISSAALKHITVMCNQSTCFTDSLWSMLS